MRSLERLIPGGWRGPFFYSHFRYITVKNPLNGMLMSDCNIITFLFSGLFRSSSHKYTLDFSYFFSLDRYVDYEDK